MSYIIYMRSHVVVYMSCNELYELYVQATMMSTNQVGYIIVIAWVARDLWPTLPSGCTLGTQLVYCHKSLAPMQ